MSSSLLDSYGNASFGNSTQWTFLTCEQQASAACSVEDKQRDHPPDGLTLLACGGKLRAFVPVFVTTFGFDAPLSPRPRLPSSTS